MTTFHLESLMTRRTAIPLLSLTTLLLLAGCAISTTPEYDTRFGDAVRQARAAMTLNPNAGANTDPVAGMDGKSSQEALMLYQGSFKAPPPVVNVINIGGATGSAN
jgi:hypothetical protein